jgi:dTDP-4-dehydrorhamnose 3,5-epimerase
MKIQHLPISGLILIEPPLFEDDRGFFFESFNHKKFEEIVGKPVHFVQDNHSQSMKGVLRGLHYQLSPRPQGKLVRVSSGEIFDVAIDLRKSSPTYGKWASAILSGQNKKQFWIPEGFAHGFVVLSESADVLYKTTDYYSPDHDRSLRWDDPQISIEWPLLPGVSPIISSKDLKASYFKDAEAFS